MKYSVKTIDFLVFQIFSHKIFVKLFQMILDGIVLAFSFALTHFFILDRVPYNNFYFWAGLLQVLFVQFLMLFYFNIYAQVWRYIGLSELKEMSYFFIGSILLLFGLEYIFQSLLPLFVLSKPLVVLNTIFSVVGLLLMRIARRLVYETYGREETYKKNEKKLRTLIVGAGSVGILAARSLRNRQSQRLLLVGFVDDDLRKQGSIIQQAPVLGGINDLPKLVEKFSIDLVVIGEGKIAGERVRRIMEICEKIPVQVRVVPAYQEILQGNIQFSPIRKVLIEDLLHREPAQLDMQSMRQFFSYKTVLITGAGGSIGSELVRQVIQFAPSRLILFELSESALFEIEQELQEIKASEIVSIVGSCRDSKRIEEIFAEYQPQIVLHAAAYKHVSLMEKNPFEAIENNVFGTRIVAEAAGKFRAEVFILVSTDKAVRPSCMMGASKRLAELVVTECNQRYQTRYLAVRFGNVLGSSGSVVPIFKKQIAKGGPVTVTDKAMVRYFMTIPEAAQLILQSASIGERGDLFILDMGKPVLIYDLALDMIRLSGLVPYEDIKIIFTGKKKGEKLEETLYFDAEKASKTKHHRIYSGQIMPAALPMEIALQNLSLLVAKRDATELCNFLAALFLDDQLKLEEKKNKSIVEEETTFKCLTETHSVANF
jgi:FlaA1/EpsC-like NDP-sugar epimerase